MPVSEIFKLEATQYQVNYCRKKIRKGQNGKVKKNQKTKKPKDVCHFLAQNPKIWISAHVQTKMSQNVVLVALWKERDAVTL